MASVDKSAYVASKHGVVGFTKGVALETATTGITCNAICPGWVLTPLVQKQIDALAAREKLSSCEEARGEAARRRSSLLSSSQRRSNSARSLYSSARTLRRSLTVWHYLWTVAGSQDDMRGRQQGKRCFKMPRIGSPPR